MSNGTEAEIIDGGEINGIDDKHVNAIKKYKIDTSRGLAYSLVIILAASIFLHYGLTIWLITTGQESGLLEINNIFNIWLPVISGFTASAVTYFFKGGR